ncbi:nucleoside diphosphate kinase regulator [Hyphomicrobium sp. NDB2Meth4]|uniref:nucleoside diphosphate kinase regulator n=1 Tax=Hyphomicrobium sp. NDB2Meth4 TaxID=1892846 RepID=UPI000931C96D|nr:nucleoside diphosphate kinase regulator [Hyphomicrobium sp. NDB2Meth4]
MNFHPPTNSLPRITLGVSEERRLSALATAAALAGRAESVARILLAEIERADIVRDDDLPSDVVRMHSWVEFEIDERNRRCVQLVYPGEANIEQNRVSILTPIGAALIGLSTGQTIPLLGHDDRPHRLTPLKVMRHPPNVASDERSADAE